jgi:hypothetical protein
MTERKEGEVVRKWMERNEGEVVRRRIERKEGERQCVGRRGRRERGLHPPPHYLSPSFLPIILLTTSLPHSSSSLPLSLLAPLFLLPLSLLPLNSPHYFSLIHLHPLPH